MRWDATEQYLYEAMDRAIDAMPESLLETDGGPVSKTADVILARLYERDGQVVREMRLDRVAPEILVPLPRQMTLASFHDGPISPSDLMLRNARFVLQSSFSTYQLAPELAPPWVTPAPPDFMVRVLFVRYRRRS